MDIETKFKLVWDEKYREKFGRQPWDGEAFLLKNTRTNEIHETNWRWIWTLRIGRPDCEYEIVDLPLRTNGTK